MSLYRGSGGAGDSTTDATITAVTQQATNAANSASAASVSASEASGSETNAATSAANALTSEQGAATDLGLTNADVVLTHADVILAEADKVQTGLDALATAADLVATNQDTLDTAADLVATNQDTLDTAADLVLTNADVVLTNADVVLTHADVVLTVADVVLTHADVVLTAADVTQTGLDVVATAADLVLTNADVTSIGNSVTAAANSAASAAAALDSFDDRYLGAKVAAPTLDNDDAALVEGALYFDSSSNGMKVYDGAVWIAASSAGTASMLTYRYISTNAQTTFTGADANSATLSYTVSNIIVLLNGVALDSSDFTATSGTSIVLGTGATTGDEFVVVAFKSFTVADHYSKSAADARFEPIDSAYTKAEADSLLNAKETVTNVALKAPLASPDFTGGIDVTGTVTADGLVVSQPSGANILLESTTGGATAGDIFGEIEFKTNDSSSVGIKGKIDSYSEGNVGNGALRFHTGNTTELAERMRIDSLGNATFNTTNIDPASNNTYGTALQQYGGISASRVNTPPLNINRAASDGEIATFRKDGTTVGSIGVENSDRLYIDSGSGNTGIRFDAGAWVPRDNGVVVDAGVDIGASGARMKDLYLSGGVHLGGTGSANKLDDYEEGTWTPTFSSHGFGATAPTTSARYVKVGNSVTVTGQISVGSIVTPSTWSYIDNLPFDATGAGRQGAGQWGVNNPASGSLKGSGFIRAGYNTNFMTLYLPADPAAGTDFIFGATYIVA